MSSRIIKEGMQNWNITFLKNRINHKLRDKKDKFWFHHKIADWRGLSNLWHWQDGSNDAKSLREPPTKFVTSYLLPVVCKPALLDIALREILCLCVVKVQIFLASAANQQNYS
ncbi:hypothetical protein PV328_004004 [Microctonus aethiopoides]|uniref:Uncharacterized protein n=1 Tax=Microctonus aethiopoides TaxID=144406 RepID=A0AA39F9M1_9HYME|nr:hypothetical protein PV328_004004 [Microctonus aethiopoides]